MTLKAHEDPAAHSTQSRGQGAVSPFATFPPDHAQDEASVCCCCSTFNSPWTFPTSPANCSLPTVRTSLVPPPAHIKTLLPQALCTCCSNWNALFFKKKKKKKIHVALSSFPSKLCSNSHRDPPTNTPNAHFICNWDSTSFICHFFLIALF